MDSVLIATAPTNPLVMDSRPTSLIYISKADFVLVMANFCYHLNSARAALCTELLQRFFFALVHRVLAAFLAI